MNVKFRNDKHKELFYKAIESKYKTNNAFMSAVYLMTVDIFFVETGLFECRYERNLV